MLWLLKADSKVLLTRKRKALFLVFIFLIIVIGIFYHRKNKEETIIEETKIQIGVVNDDSSELSKLFLDFFNKSEVFRSYAEIFYGTEKIMKEKLAKDELQMYLVIPKNFVQNMIAIENTPIRIVINTSDTTKALLMKNLLEGYEKFISAVEINCVTLYEVMELDGLSEELITEKNIEISLDLVTSVINKNDLFQRLTIENFKNIPLFFYYGCEIVLLLMMYSSVVCGIHLIKEMQSKILSRLFTAGVNPLLIFFEKLILYSTITALPGILAFVIFCIIWKEKILITCIIFYLVSSMFCCSLVIAFSACFRSIQSYLLASNVIILFLTILGGGIIPLMYLPQTMVKFSKITPNYWFISNLFTILKDEKNTNNNLLSLGLFIFSLGLMAIGCFIYARKEAQVYEEN